MNLDDGNPNPPESNVTVFTGTGTQTIPIPVAQLGDGYHGEGVPCLADSDQDGWSDGAEEIIGTDPFDACADNPADDAWPADINNSGFSDTADIVFLTSDFGDAVPAPHLRDTTYHQIRRWPLRTLLWIPRTSRG